MSTGDRLSHKPPLSWTTKNFPANISIVLDPTIKYQQILGFGGAFTESAAYVWSQLNSKLQQEVIDAYFGPNGHHYTVCRTHINSCDFSLANFSFDDKVDDFSLQNFTVAHSQTWMFPFMKAAITRRSLTLSQRPYHFHVDITTQ
jgi:glucosylceramidase